MKQLFHTFKDASAYVKEQATKGFIGLTIKPEEDGFVVEGKDEYLSTSRVSDTVWNKAKNTIQKLKETVKTKRYEIWQLKQQLAKAENELAKTARRSKRFIEPPIDWRLTQTETK